METVSDLAPSPSQADKVGASAEWVRVLLHSEFKNGSNQSPERHANPFCIRMWRT